jgi:hypothetical protein
VELNAQYFTERLEQLRARPADGGSDEDRQTTEEIFRGMLSMLPWFDQLAERIKWLEEAFARDMERQLRLMNAS